jgi:hypothetical protein
MWGLEKMRGFTDKKANIILYATLAQFGRLMSPENVAARRLGFRGYPLEDHKLVHRLIGITKLIAFDMESDVVARQRFNRPIDACHCIHRESGDLISNFDQVLSECNCADATGVVVWLDYTDPRQIGRQIREFQALLDKLKAGDIVRVCSTSLT